MGDSAPGDMCALTKVRTIAERLMRGGVAVDIEPLAVAVNLFIPAS